MTFSLRVTLGTLIVATGAIGQESSETSRFLVAQQMRLTPGASEDDYVGIEKTWRRIHQKRIDLGIQAAWYCFKVRNGGRTQFRTFDVYDSMEQRDSTVPEGTWQDFFSAEEIAKLDKTGSTRDIIQSELWRSHARTVVKEPLAESDVVQVHYIKATPGKVGDYIDMEVELFERLHQARVDKGQLKFWAFLSRDFPGGTERDWDFVTIQVFKDAESMDKPWPSELADEVLSKEELDSFPKAGELRRIYREEYWRPIAFAASKEE